MKVVVTGGSGFIGGHVVRHLVSEGHSVVALSRKAPSDARRVPGATYAVGVDIADATTLTAEQFEGAEAVVHLVGIIQERGRLQTFERIHVTGTRNVVARAKESSDCKKVVYLSAIGADSNAGAHYSRTKAAAEALVGGSGLPFTIIRPSIVLGGDGEFVDQMKALVKSGGLPVDAPFPFIPVPGSGRNLFQPIFVDDLAACIGKAINLSVAVDATIEVGGPTQVSFNALLDAFAAALGIRKPKLHVPIPILMLVAPLMGILPNPPVTRDQLKNLGRDNICDLGQMRKQLGVDPIGFDESMHRVFSVAGARAKSN